MYKHTQRSFAGGRLDASLMGRQDLSKYFTGASELKNLLVRRQGSVAKRRGTDFAADLTNLLGTTNNAVVPLGSHRLLPLVCERDRGYYALLADGRAFLLDTERGIWCSDGKWRRRVDDYARPTDDSATVTQDGYVITTPDASSAEYTTFTDYVARIGTTTYDTLKQAADACQNGETVVLGRDVETTVALTFKGTLDLNGHTLSVNANKTITFNPGTAWDEDHPCGIVSSSPGGKIKWTYDGAITVNGITHQSGYFTLADVEADFPSTSSSAALLHSSAGNYDDNQINIDRCVLSARCGHGIVYLSGTISNQESDIDLWGDSAELWMNGSCYIRRSVLNYETTLSATTTAANPCPLMTSTITSSNVRKFTFASGEINSPDTVAANIGLFVYGGRLDCLGVGVTTSSSYASAISKVYRGLTTFTAGTSYVASGTELRQNTFEDNGTTWNVYMTANDISEIEDARQVFWDSDWGSISEADAEQCYITGDWSDILEHIDWTPAVWPNYSWKSQSAETASDDEEDEGSAYAGDGSTRSLTAGAAPYCVRTAYTDSELDELDSFQSGDTLFLAHANHSPAKLVFDPNAFTFAFSRLKMNAAAWAPPVLKSASANVHPGKCEAVSEEGYSKTTVSGLTRKTETWKKTSSGMEKTLSTSITLPSRTITYVVTYVKDGQESPPSNSISVTYGAPWEQGGKVTLSFSRGKNAEEPDYYNVYKKQSTEYGLIGSTTRPVWSEASPSAFGYDAANDKALAPGMAPSAVVGSEVACRTEAEDVLGERPSNAFDGAECRAGDGTAVYCGVGGMRFGGRAVFEYGPESRVVADRLYLAFDAHTLRYEQAAGGGWNVYDDMALSGKDVEVTVFTTPTKGSTRKLAAKVYNAALDAVSGVYSGTATRSCGAITAGATRVAARQAAGMALRTAEIDLSSLANDMRQVVRVVVRCTDGNGAECETVLCGFALRRAATGGTTFEDDYITPDMSLTPPKDESAFCRRGEYPSCVGVYQQRLVFAATADRPNAFWMSCVGDLYNFTQHESAREDDSIEAEVAALEFPRLNHLVFSRDLVMLGDGGEWRVAPVSGNALSFKTVSATLQSQIGSAKWTKPVTVGNEIVFLERSGTAMRSIVYGYSSDGYESTDLTVLSSELFAGNAVRRMCYKQHPDSTIVCVLADGTVAAMVYMKEHEVCAWTRHVLGGGARALDCATSKALNGATTDVAITVEAGEGAARRVELWRVRPDSAARSVAAQACLDGCETLTGAAAWAAWRAGWVAVDAQTGSVFGSAAELAALDGYAAREFVCGFPFEAELVTVRPEVPQQGTIQFELKNAKDVEVRAIGSAGWRAAPVGLADHQRYAQRVGASEWTAPERIRDKRLLLAGENTGDGRVQLKSDDPWPLQILSISTDYEIQPLSESEG